VIYDDACHLKKFATNKTRSTETDTSVRIANMTMVVDRFHFPGHVDSWCKKNCNPDDFDELKDVCKAYNMNMYNLIAMALTTFQAFYLNILTSSPS